MTQPSDETPQHALPDAPARVAAVTGATGFVGRWLLIELTRRGIPVIALIRRASERIGALAEWLDRRGGNAALLDAVDFDLTAPALGLTPEGRERLQDLTELYHLAAARGPDLTRSQAHAANVQGPLHLATLAAKLPTCRRLIVLASTRTDTPKARALDPTAIAAFAATHGEVLTSLTQLRRDLPAHAKALALPLTVISAGMVLGDSQTGETTTRSPLTAAIERLFWGSLGDLTLQTDAFVPVISVDLLATILATAAHDPQSANHAFAAFDPETPPIRHLLAWAAARFDLALPAAPTPNRTLANPLGRRSPTRAALHDTDRLDPRPMLDFMDRAQLRLPPLRAAFDRGVDFLIDTRFLRQPALAAQNRFISGTRVFVRGDRRYPDAVLLHGLLHNQRTWQPVEAHLPFKTLAPDLPGVGASAPGGGQPTDWVNSLLAPAATRPLLVGHSLGAAFALEAACARPQRIAGLVLISPFFLQPRPGWLYRQPWLMRHLLRHAGVARLAAQLGAGGGDGQDELRADTATLLARPPVAHWTALWLAWAAQPDTRARLQRLLAETEVPTILVVGGRDPLSRVPPKAVTAAHVTTINIDGAGHHPQLSHPKAVAAAIRRAMSRATAQS